MKKPSDSCSGRKLEIKTALQQLSVHPTVTSLPRDLTPFPARIRRNCYFAAPIWSDGARVFERALPDIRILPGKIRYPNTEPNPEHTPDEQWLSRLLRPSSCSGNFLTTSQLRRNGKLVCFGILWLVYRHDWCQASRGNPRYPSDLANLTVTSVRDLTIGYDSSNPPLFKPTLPLSSGNMITFGAKDETTRQEVVLTIRHVCGPPSVTRAYNLTPARTSGTEPKVMLYSTPSILS